MREIKFRAKMIDPVGHDGFFAYSGIDGNWSSISGTYYGEVDPETIGEFINETDMSNNELYTGDIVKFDVREVFGEHPELDQIGVISCKELGTIRLGDWLLGYCINIKKIGNIYENPLEVKDE